MAWDFSTEPDFQAQLAWVREFVKTEIDPIEVLFPRAALERLQYAAL